MKFSTSKISPRFFALILVS